MPKLKLGGLGEMKETKEVLVYACGYCGELYYKKEQADYCHADRTCSKCGIVIGKDDYYTNCKSCRDKKELEKQQELYDKARKMTYEEYTKEFPEHWLCWGDRYYQEPEDMEYDFEEESDTPKWVWGTSENITMLDGYDIVSNFEENTEIEDFELGKTEFNEILEFCKEWNKKYSVKSYSESNKIAVIL